jgi:SAM-dependent methyltransferase
VRVLGVDVAETALAMARGMAAERGIEAEFAAADAFHLDRLGRRFQTVLDSGLFHTFEEADERTRYVASLSSVTDPGATLYVLCFSDRGPETGPHPVRESVLRAAFSPGAGWEITSLIADRIHTRFHADGAPAWLATIRRI